MQNMVNIIFVKTESLYFVVRIDISYLMLLHAKMSLNN